MSQLSAFFILVCATLLNGQFAAADTGADKGLEIAKQMKARDIGWIDSSAAMQMTLRNRSGKETHRKMRIKSLEVHGDGDKSMTIFDTPRDVKGTAFLSFTHSTTADDQWLYLPALKRVKRISSKNKSGPFMGSEFAYEDLSSFEVEKFSFRWLRDEEINGKLCYVVESIPTDKFSGYTRQVAWIEQNEYLPLKIEFYDRKKSHLKTLTISDYQQYLSKHWRPGKQQMVNHLNGKTTDIVMSNYQFQSGINESDFTENSLKRAR